jgi:iron(III) transport system substrate-binding protein
VIWSWSQQADARALVVYCAHDAVYADPILRRFTEETGIPVVIRYDTEATKSLGLVDQLMTEKGNTECDLFWNNELLGMVALAESDRLVTHQGEGWKNRGPGDRDERGRWTGFAARARVWIATRTFAERYPTDQAAAFEDYFRTAPDLSRVAIARPLYGTTLTQVSLMVQEQGLNEVRDELQAAVKSRQLRVVAGNGVVKNLVASGAADLGWTDTDDAFSAMDDGAAVTMTPLLYKGRAILIPNTVALIAKARQRPEAKQLLEYLLSPPVELALAKSASRQIPLGPMDDNELPDEVLPLMSLKDRAWPLATLIESGTLPKAHREAIEWLRHEDLVR